MSVITLLSSLPSIGLIYRLFSLLGTSSINIFVLDEADEMLSRGFKDQIYDVFKTLNQEVQVRCRSLCLKSHNYSSLILLMMFRSSYFLQPCQMMSWRSASAL